MAFPYVFESNWAPGDATEWTSTTDTQSKLDVAHYTTLAKLPWQTATPYTGAYAMRTRLTGQTQDATVTSTSAVLSADGAFGLAFPVWFSPDFAVTADDTAVLLELHSSGPATELSVGFKVTNSTGNIQIGFGETAPTAFDPQVIQRGQWYVVEVTGNLDSGAGNDGDAQLFVSKYGDGPQLTTATTALSGLDQGEITEATLGIQDQLATTKGTILFGGLILDDTRVYPRRVRFPDERLLTKTDTLFVGPGELENITLIDGGSGDCGMVVYDTDRANTNDIHTSKIILHATANNEIVDPAGVPVSFSRGCHVVLTGTNPRAHAKLCYATSYSVQGYKLLGIRRAS